MREYLLIENAVVGKSLAVIPEAVPYDVAALNEPMAVALTLIASMGYPTEIFEVTPQLTEHAELFANLISHRVPFGNVEHAYDLALTPGAAEKVIVTFDDEGDTTVS
jgi:(R,R)-butanediol dehydrogenase/meso-butanediol dehydrogenase/diacetyl reductase